MEQTVNFNSAKFEVMVNMPGYLPNPDDVYTVVGIDRAIDALIDEIEKSAEAVEEEFSMDIDRSQVVRIIEATGGFIEFAYNYYHEIRVV